MGGFGRAGADDNRASNAREIPLNRTALALIATLALVACASPAPEQVAAADASKSQCLRELSTGSNIMAMRCRTAEERAAEKARADDAKGAMRTSGRPSIDPAGTR
jgi:hypothetical protein